MSILKIKDGNGNWIDVPAVAGLSPTVSVQNIQGGHRVTITDATHPQGQSFDVMDGSGSSGSIDPEAANEIYSAMERGNQTTYSDVELPLNGYIDATTHEFIESSEYKCSGYVYVKGVHTIEYKARSIGDSYQMCFYDKNKNSIPALDFPIINDGTESTLDITGPEYSEVCYIIMSAYTGGYPPYLRLRGKFDLETCIHEEDIEFTEGNNLFNPKKCKIGYEINNLDKIASYEKSVLSGWIRIPENTSTIYFKNLPTYDGGNNAHRFGCWYNANRELIGALDLQTSLDTAAKTVPANTKYLRFTVITNVYPTTPTINDYSNLMVSALDIPYEPYQSTVSSIMGMSVGGNDQVVKNTEDIEILNKTASIVNKVVSADIDLPLNGYIDATTHEFVESNDYKCSGLVLIKGARFVEYKTRSIGNSYHICFYDKHKNSLPTLDFPVANEGIQGTIDLSNPIYSEAYYLILSAYPGGYPPFLRLKGDYDFTEAIFKKDLDYEEGYNLFDISGCTRGKGLNANTGALIEDAQSIVSNLMTIPPASERGATGNLHFYNLPVTESSKRFVQLDEDMNVVRGPSDIPSEDTSIEIGIASNAKYLRFTLVRGMSTLPTESEIETMYGQTIITVHYRMTEYQPYHRNISEVDGIGLCASSVANLYKGKKWVVIGDSLTEKNTRSTKFYYDYVKEWLGFDVVNMGVSGTGYKSRDDVDNPTTNGAFYQRATLIPADTDVVTIFGSFNDLTQGFTLGTPGDTGTTTICGCMKATIEAIYTINPAMKLGIIAPCPWNELNPSNANAVAYVEALHDICMQNSIPFLNLFYESGLRPWIREVRDLVYNLDSETDGDFHGTHPNAIGHEMIASKIKVFIQSLI